MVIEGRGGSREGEARREGGSETALHCYFIAMNKISLRCYFNTFLRGGPSASSSSPWQLPFLASSEVGFVMPWKDIVSSPLPDPV